MDPHTLWVLFPSLFMYWEALVYKASHFFFTYYLLNLYYMEMHQNVNLHIDIFIDKFNFLKVPQDLQAAPPASPLLLPKPAP